MYISYEYSFYVNWIKMLVLAGFVAFNISFVPKLFVWDHYSKFHRQDMQFFVTDSQLNTYYNYLAET